MDTQHHPHNIQLFNKGANVDNAPSSLERAEGSYLDSQNMRTNNLGGVEGDLSKIKGEVVEYPNTDNRCGGSGQPMPLSYECVAKYRVLNHQVEFWADELQVGVPYVRVDGFIVLMPSQLSDFPISTQYPPQVHGNDSCGGGEIYYTDNHIEPFRLNVTDMLNNSGISNGVQNCDNATDKYFSEFNINQYSIQPPASADHPVFVEIVGAGTTPNSIGIIQTHGTGGMKVGCYQYGVQFVDSTGNTTNISEYTPQIPLPLTLEYQTDNEEQIYPGTKVTGGSGGQQSVNGIHIRFRVNNLNNYSYVQVIRIEWIAGAPVNTPPLDTSVIAKIPINNGQISVIDFYDYDNTTISPLATDQTINNLTAIEAAKGIRYYNSRLTLWNVTYASRDVSGSLGYVGGSPAMYPFIRPLGFMGYHDIYNDVYRKSFFRAEKYGFSIVLFDSNFNASWAVPITGYENFAMPNRRDVLSGNSLLASSEAATQFGTKAVGLSDNVKAANSSGGFSQTFEVFDTVGGRGKNTSSLAMPNSGNTQLNQHNICLGGCPPKWQSFVDFDYQPFRPCNIQDTNPSQYDYIINPEVFDGEVPYDNSIDSTYFSNPAPAWGQAYNSMWIGAGGIQYNPKGFQYNLWALGMSFNGINEFPSWVAAFTIMRTEAANRVVAQGQSYYDMYRDSSLPFQTDKTQNSVIWNSPDFDSAYVNVSNIINNIGSGQYKVQLSSPLGMFSEMYYGLPAYYDHLQGGLRIPSTHNNAWKPPTTDFSQADMISYCRILRDQNIPNNNSSGNGNDFNPSLVPFNMSSACPTDGTYFYTDFNRWRNTTINGNSSPFIIGLNSLVPNSSFGQNPRQNAYRMNLQTSLYANSPCSGFDFIQPNVRNFHEPLHVINIIDESRNIPNSNVTTYYQTGVWCKIQSLIGLGGSQSYTLVDERWQDCIPDLNINYPMATQARFIWVSVNNVQQAWLNITYLKTLAPSTVSTIITDITNTGSWTGSLDACHGTVTVYGVYTHTITPYQITSGINSFNENTYTINFDQLDNNNKPLIPPAGSALAPVYVYVKYDSCAPVEVFGGDTYIGEYNYPVADAQTDNNANTWNHTNGYPAAPLPYRTYQINEGVNIDLQDTQGSGQQISQFNTVRLSLFKGTQYNTGSIRQLLCNGIVESRTNTAMDFGNFFANVNYVMTPYSWSGGSNIYGRSPSSDPFYFGNQAPNYGYGGLLYYPSFQDTGYEYGGFQLGNVNYNYDYSEIPTQNTQFSKPVAGFTEKLNYCTRAVWSSQRSTAEEDAPNVLDFPSPNVYDFDDAVGEFKRAWDSSIGGQQGNLYAFAENGIVMALTNKNILTEISGNQLAVIGDTGDTSFIQSEVWLTRSIGMNDEMWRSAAEYDNKIWFANKNSIYRLQDNRLTDIGEVLYASTVKNVLASISSGYGSDVTAVWCDKYKEYWVQVNPHRTLITGTGKPVIYMYSNPNTPNGTEVFQNSIIDYQYGTTTVNIENIDNATVSQFYFVNNTNTTITIITARSEPNITVAPYATVRIYFNLTWMSDGTFDDMVNTLVWNEKGDWVGQFKYHFDKYSADVNGNVYGAKYGATYSLDSGYIINSQNIGAWVSQTVNPREGYQKSKEFIRSRVNANYPPDFINWYQDMPNYLSDTWRSQVSNSVQYAIKNYGGGWESYVPRDALSPYYRNQGRYTLYKLLYSQPTEWNVSSVDIMWKALK